MPTSRSFDVELNALETLREHDPSCTLEPLRKALTHRNNFIVAKEAKLAMLHRHQGLTEALATAFYSFLPNEKKPDPQCWAKTALAEALAAFEYQEEAMFLAGMHHFQPEASWGPPVDSAGQLRGVCALALVQCRSLSSIDVLTHLLPLFADKVLSASGAARNGSGPSVLDQDEAATLVMTAATVSTTAEPAMRLGIMFTACIVGGVPDMALAIARLIAIEVVKCLRTTIRKRAVVAVVGVVTVVNVAIKTMRPVEPGTRSDEDTSVEPVGTVVAVGRAVVGSVVVVAVRTAWRYANADSYLCRSQRNCAERCGGCREDCQGFPVVHDATSIFLV